MVLVSKMHIFCYALLTSGHKQLGRLDSMRSLCTGELALWCECMCRFLLLTCFQAKLFHHKNLKLQEASEPTGRQLFWEGIIILLIAEFFKNFNRHHIKLLAEAAHLQFDLLSSHVQRAGLLPSASDMASSRHVARVKYPQLVSAISNTRQHWTKNKHWSCSFNSLLSAVLNPGCIIYLLLSYIC